jgi:hypothetical protein
MARRQQVEYTSHFIQGEHMMKMTRIGAFLLVGAFAVGGTSLRAANMTLEGTVSDAKCGAKHMMKDAVACTKACVDGGSDYALVVGNKVYTLKTSNAQEKTELAKLAGKMAKITGDVTGDNVMVKTVTMGTANKK